MNLLSRSLLCFLVVPMAASAADFHYPLSAVISKDGDMYIADLRLPGIWKVKDGKAEIYFQASKKFRTPLNAVRCVALDSKGRLLAADSSTREIYRFDKDDKPQPLTDGFIGIPMSIAADGRGTLYVADLETQRIWTVSEDGGKPREFATIRGPRGLCFDKDGNLLVANAGSESLVSFDKDGKKTALVEKRSFQFPHNVAVDDKGTAYVTDGYGKCLWKVTAGSKPEKLAADGDFVNPVGLIFHDEKLVVVDPRANAVFHVTIDGKVTKVLSGRKRQ